LPLALTSRYDRRGRAAPGLLLWSCGSLDVTDSSSLPRSTRLGRTAPRLAVRNTVVICRAEALTLSKRAKRFPTFGIDAMSPTSRLRFLHGAMPLWSHRLPASTSRPPRGASLRARESVACSSLLNVLMQADLRARAAPRRAAPPGSEGGKRARVEEAGAAIALVQHPQQGALVVRGCDGPAGRAVEPTSPHLGLAVGAQVREAAVGLEPVDQSRQVSTASARLWPDPSKPIGGGVVAGDLAVRRAHEAADRQVEAGRAELALVAAPWLPREDPVGGAPVSRSTVSIARSTSASPRRLRL
jgi:hypothetical protein